MNTITIRERLQRAAIQISANRASLPASPAKALRKLFVQERRDWAQPTAPRVGWKRGEIFEVLEAAVNGGNWRSEWGDVGYYVAQTWAWLWRLYVTVTPWDVQENAARKFERRAEEGR